MDARDLLAELRFLRTTMERLYAQAQPADAGWRLVPAMRTLLELGNHLAQIPAVDLACSREQPQADVQQLEAALRREQFDQLLAVWDQGCQAVEAHFGNMPAEEFETRSSRAFYGHAAVQKQWLLNMVTHAYHHRGQFFTYLKVLGRPVDMFTLY